MTQTEVLWPPPGTTILRLSVSRLSEDQSSPRRTPGQRSARTYAARWRFSPCFLIWTPARWTPLRRRPIFSHHNLALSPFTSDLAISGTLMSILVSSSDRDAVLSLASRQPGLVSACFPGIFGILLLLLYHIIAYILDNVYWGPKRRSTY